MQHLKSFLLLLLIQFTVSCAKSTEKSVPSENPATQERDDKKLGSGGYASKNSEVLLEDSIKSLLKKLDEHKSTTFEEIPEGWNIQRISDVVARTKMSFLKSYERDGKELLFDYNREEESIEALRAFFMAYSWVGDSISERDRIAIQRDIEKKLLHEVAHLFGYDEESSSQFSKTMYSKLSIGYTLCHKKGLSGVPIPPVFERFYSYSLSPAYRPMKTLGFKKFEGHSFRFSSRYKPWKNQAEVHRRANEGIFIIDHKTLKGFFVDRIYLLRTFSGSKHLVDTWLKDQLHKKQLNLLEWKTAKEKNGNQFLTTEVFHPDTNLHIEYQLSDFADKSVETKKVLRLKYDAQSDVEKLQGATDLNCYNSYIPDQLLDPVKMPKGIECRYEGRKRVGEMWPNLQAQTQVEGDNDTNDGHFFYSGEIYLNQLTDEINIYSDAFSLMMRFYPPGPRRITKLATNVSPFLRGEFSPTKSEVRGEPMKSKVICEFYD